jgi:hypothetical protein
MCAYMFMYMWGTLVVAKAQNKVEKVDAATNTIKGPTDITDSLAQPPASAEVISTETLRTNLNLPSVSAAPYAGTRANVRTTTVVAHENQISQADPLPGPRDAIALSPVFKEYPSYVILSGRGPSSCTIPAPAGPMWHHVPRHYIPLYPPVLPFPQDAAQHWPSRMHRPGIYNPVVGLPHRSQ